MVKCRETAAVLKWFILFSIKSQKYNINTRSPTDYSYSVLTTEIGHAFIQRCFEDNFNSICKCGCTSEFVHLNKLPYVYSLDKNNSVRKKIKSLRSAHSFVVQLPWHLNTHYSTNLRVIILKTLINFNSFLLFYLRAVLTIARFHSAYRAQSINRGFPYYEQN